MGRAERANPGVGHGIGRARAVPYGAWLAGTLTIAAALAVADVAIMASATLIGLLVLPPLLSCVRLGPRTTALVGVACMGLAVGLGFPDEIFGETDHGLRLAVVLAGSLLAIWIADLRERVETAHAQAQASGDQLSAILEGIADGVTAQGPDGRLLYANDAAVRTMGYRTAEEMLKTPPERIVQRFEVFDEDGRPFPLEQLPGRRALLGESASATVKFRIKATGEERWSVIKATPIYDESSTLRMAINVIEDVTEHKRTEEEQRLLVDVGEALAASLDYEATLQAVAHLTVPALADWCAVDVLDAEGRLIPAAVAHRDPAKAAAVNALRADHALEPGAEPGVPSVLASGTSVLYADLAAVHPADLGAAERHSELLAEVGVQSLMVVPLVARGRTLGAITLATVPLRRFAGGDLALAEEVARRAALAVDNARLYSERSYIARALQQSLLPPGLPDVPGVEVAARFRPAGEGNEVGGDFYDVFEIRDGSWGLVIGDVCGKGADAAAITALARYTVRTAAMQRRSPVDILGVLNDALLRQRHGHDYCTVAYVRLDIRGDRMRMTAASGGHPLPLLLGADGQVRTVGRPGTLLGILEEPELNEEALDLRSGDSLVLYTDGVTDAQAPERILGPEELAAVLVACQGCGAAESAQRLEQEAAGPDGRDPRDDIAILVARMGNH